MWIFGQSTEKKWERAVRQEAKALTKQLIEAGMKRQEAKSEMEKLFVLVMEAYRQSKAYEKSKSQMLFAQMLIEKLLEEVFENEGELEVNSCSESDRLMTENLMPKSIGVEERADNSEVNGNKVNEVEANPNKVNCDKEIKERLKKLVSVLGEVFHECTIREDDIDFKLTCDYFNNVAKAYKVSGRLMLQSELENLHYLLADILQWEAPDFLALAYFCKFGDKSKLGEFSNNQRNEMLLKYYNEKYWNEFERKLLEVGMKETVERWIGKVNKNKL